MTPTNFTFLLIALAVLLNVGITAILWEQQEAVLEPRDVNVMIEKRFELQSDTNEMLRQRIKTAEGKINTLSRRISELEPPLVATTSTSTTR